MSKLARDALSRYMKPMRFLFLVLTLVSGRATWAGPLSPIAEIKPGAKGWVVLFLSARCPSVESHLSLLQSLPRRHKDFTFIAVHSNADERKTLSETFFKSANLPFRVIEDDNQLLADKYKAGKTPHAVVLSTKEEILYHGGITDSAKPESATQNYLDNALTEIESGKTVSHPVGRTLGCYISRGENYVW